MFKKIIRNTTLLSSGILSSRILGVIRDIIIAKYFGTSKILESFVVAFRIPNLLRSLLGEGFSDSVAVPVFSEYQKDKKRLNELGRKVTSLLVFFLIFVVIAGIFFSKFLVMLIAPGFLKDIAKFNLTVKFTQFLFLYLFFIGMVALFNAFFYAEKRFFLPAFSPCIFNLSLIVGILFFKRYFEGYILILSVLVAGFLQFLLSFLFLGWRKKMGVKLREIKGIFKDKDIIRMLKLFFPRVWSTLVYQLSVFVDTVFSSLSWIVGEGALAAIYYANRIIQFPLALVAISISRVAIVDFSYFYKNKNYADFKKLFLFSFQNILFFIIPFSLILIISGRDILEVLFMRGAFSLYSLNLTSSVLFFYSFGLFFFCGIKLLVNSFYALKDTLTPAKNATIALVINVILSAILIFPLKIAGVALASSLAAAFNFFSLFSRLNQRIKDLISWKDLKGYILKLLLCGFLSALFFKSIFSLGEYNKYIRAFLAVMGGGILFLFLGNLLKIEQINYLRRWIRRR